MICDICGRIIDCKYKRPDALPAGVGIQLNSGQVLNVCMDCIMDPSHFEKYVVKIIDAKEPLH